MEPSLPRVLKKKIRANPWLSSTVLFNMLMHMNPAEKKCRICFNLLVTAEAIITFVTLKTNKCEYGYTITARGRFRVKLDPLNIFVWSEATKCISSQTW